MRRAVLEFPLPNGKWRLVETEVYYSRKGNLYVKYNGSVYVFRNWKPGTPVFTKQDGKWVLCGRITEHLEVFIGDEGQLSYWEHVHKLNEEQIRQEAA